MNERNEAEAFNRQLELLLAGELSADSDLLAAAQRLAALPELLPPPDPQFEGRVWTRVRRAQTRRPERFGRLGWRPRPGLRWLAPLAALLLAVIVLLPGPRQALGNWMAHFRIGGVQVAVVPEETVRPSLVATVQEFASLAQAERAAGLPLLQPGYLPPAYGVRSVQAVTYTALPAWMQPLYVEITYGPTGDDASRSTYALLREYNAGRPGQIKVGQIEFQSQTVHQAQELTLPNGLPAVLVELESGQGGEGVVFRQLVWQQGGRTVELWSETLPVEELVRIAGSLR